jgi:hypothetical protein
MLIPSTVSSRKMTHEEPMAFLLQGQVVGGYVGVEQPVVLLVSPTA